jgi:hypothetical protein
VGQVLWLMMWGAMMGQDDSTDSWARLLLLSSPKSVLFSTKLV